ncbi:hypothetical protein C1645_834658 [Glomus cerebriforme]|uniref:F-box domain-containing protein n=1 Tax=Glomus cerebriforme TaxID=658196 RepID=A0A397SJA2_9GLOM|nr:hypothetical protein C1645_834658 [Glomus cerebriforme]
MVQLLADCLSEIFEHLEKDKFTLHSCLLANRLCCEISVRILWRYNWDYTIETYNTLISCLPNESKELLYENGIIIPSQTSKPPNQQPSQNLSANQYHIVTREIFKLFMNQISLKKLVFWQYSNIDFTFHHGAESYFKNLFELNCSSNLSSEFFYQLSQISHNIRSLIIEFENNISSGLSELIFVQKKLKYMSIIKTYNCKDLTDILSKLPDTLIKLYLSGGELDIPLSFIIKFSNLQELELSFDCAFKDFKKLQYVTFPHLQILKFEFKCPIHEELIKFLEYNGKNLKELYLGDDKNSINHTIAKLCPNLRKLSAGFKNHELETLKMIFFSCQYLESIKIWCGGSFLNEKDALDMIVNYSPKNICELNLYYLYDLKPELLPEELESFFISWKNRIPQKSLSLVITTSELNILDANKEYMEIIEKYIKSGIIKSFKS